LLDRYYEEKWQIIPIRTGEKRPMWKNWPKRSISYLKARDWINHDQGNIAVVTGHGLTILDYDKRPGRITENIEFFRSYKTLLCFTPRGYHVYYQSEKKPSKAQVKKRSLTEGLESVRWENQYTLLPPSSVDGRAYWWLDSMKQPLREW